MRREKSELNCCQDCKAILNTDNWSPSLRGETGHSPRYICRICWTARQRKYASNTPQEALREMKNASRINRESKWSHERKVEENRRRYGNWLKKKYGITIEDYDRMMISQSRRCAICRTEEPSGKGRFHVDHCHESNKVRGLLCTSCNMMLGLARDCVGILNTAIKYLEDHKPENRAKVGGKAY